MKKYRIKKHGQYLNVFDVQMKRWYGWILIKRYKGTPFFHDDGKYNIGVALELAEELLKKLEEE